MRELQVRALVLIALVVLLLGTAAVLATFVDMVAYTVRKVDKHNRETWEEQSAPCVAAGGIPIKWKHSLKDCVFPPRNQTP